MTLDDMLPIIVAALGCAGLWAFLSLRAKQSHERALKDEERSAEFNETLREQVDRLADKLDKLTADKEQLLREMSDMKAALAQANTTIKHLEELLRSRK